MTDKESTFDHKPPVFPSPASGKQSCQIPIGAHSSSPKSSGAFASYSESLPAKGKLILPTAIWVVIILAGICFLSLMGSLTKTMKTLDTLVELELESSRHAKERAPKSGHDVAPIKEPLVLDRDTQASWLRPKSDSSWLFNSAKIAKRPSEASSSVLYSDDDSEKLMPSELNDAIESMFNQMMSDELSQPKGDNNLRHVNRPVSSRIVISSSVVKPAGSLSLQEQRQPAEPSLMLDSLMKDLLEESKASEPSAHSGNADDDSDKSSQLKPIQQSAPSSGSLITANIDNLNINFNSPNDPNDDTKSKAQEENLDESIESFISKAFNGGDISDSGSDLPGLHQLFSNKFATSATSSPMLSIMAQPSQQPDSMRLVVKFDGDKTTSDRPKIPSSSPYEFSVGQDMVAPKHKSVMDSQLESLSGELVKILNSASTADNSNNPSPDDSDIEGLSRLRASAKNSQQGSKLNNDDSFVVLKFDNADQVNSFGDNAQPPKKLDQDVAADNKVGDLFKLFFGPPPDSKLVVMPTDHTVDQAKAKVEEPTQKPHRHHHHKTHHKQDDHSKKIAELTTIAPEMGPIVSERFASTIQPIPISIMEISPEAQSSGDKNATKVEGK